MNPIYQQMWDKAIPLIESNRVVREPYFHSKVDHKRGLTLLGRIHGPIAEAINSFANELKFIEPQQYIYPQNALHITILPFVSFDQRASSPEQDKQHYQQELQKTLGGNHRFSVHFKGVTATETGVAVCGYVDNDSLAKLRMMISQQLHEQHLPHPELDQYDIESAQVMVMHFRLPLQKPLTLSSFLYANLQRDFGVFEVSQLELIDSDRFQSAANTKVLAEFTLLHA